MKLDHGLLIKDESYWNVLQIQNFTTMWITMQQMTWHITSPIDL